MKRLFLLIGLVVFLTPMLVNAESVFKSELPKCIKKNKFAIKSSSAKDCYAKIMYPKGDVYEGEVSKVKDKRYYYNGRGTLTLVNGTKISGLWINGFLEEDLKDSNNTKSTINSTIYLGKYHCLGANYRFYKSTSGCSTDITITKKRYENKKAIIYLSKKNTKKQSTLSKKSKKKSRLTPCVERKLASMSQKQAEDLCFGSKRTTTNKIQYSFYKEIIDGDVYYYVKNKSVEKGYEMNFEIFARALGCGSKSKDVDDCVRRWLPSIAGTGPLTLEQINEVKKDKKLMGEVVFAIDEMNRAQNQSTNSNQEQDQNTDGYYKEQSNGQYVWVDTRSGYEKFTDRFCFNCSAAQVYMINRATKRYFQGAPLSGWDKFVLRGGNTSKVIKFYK